MTGLGLRRPIVLGAFGGASSVELTAIVSNEGGLGGFGLYGYGRERILHTAAELRSRTTAPFALNLWLPRGDEIETADAAEFAAHVTTLHPLFAAAGVEPPAAPPERYLPPFDEQFEAVLEARPAFLSVVFGVPDAATVAAAHDAGIRVIGTATTVDEARALAAGGVDAVIASGAEAGGHRVSFLRPAAESLVPLADLLPAIVAAVDVPVLAAGGIGDAAGVRAALDSGAEAAVVGSAFLATEQSAAAPSYRTRLRATPPEATTLTTVMSGRLARGIRNRAMRELEAIDREVGLAAFPVQNWLTGVFRAAAATADDAELLSLWAGETTVARSHTDARELFRALIPD